jgi:hypothetical protein
MKRVLLGLLAFVLILAVLGAAGFVGYQYGYRQGALLSSADNTQLPPGHPNISPNDMPMHNFGRDRGFGHGFGMMQRGIGFGFFWPLMFLGRILFWALVIGVIYWLITRSGWRLTRETTVNPPTTVETYTKVEKTETETD